MTEEDPLQPSFLRTDRLPVPPRCFVGLYLLLHPLTLHPVIRVEYDVAPFL